jgi:hypothetical protein
VKESAGRGIVTRRCGAPRELGCDRFAGLVRGGW